MPRSTRAVWRCTLCCTSRRWRAVTGAPTDPPPPVRCATGLLGEEQQQLQRQGAPHACPTR